MYTHAIKPSNIAVRGGCQNARENTPGHH